MKTKLTSLLFAAAVWCAPLAFSVDPPPAPPMASKDSAAPEARKNSLTRAERARLKEAREAADKDPAVLAAKEAEAAAVKKSSALKRSKTAKPEEVIAAGNEVTATRAKYVALRREVIAKTDKEAAEFDVRAYAAGEALRKAREENAKAAKKSESSSADRPAQVVPPAPAAD